MKQQDRDLIERFVGHRYAGPLLWDMGGVPPTRLTTDDKARIRRLIVACQTGVRDPGAGYTGKGIRHDFHLVDVAARYCRMAARR